MHVDDILRADFENELANCLEERQSFDVASRAANFRDDDVVFAFIRKFTNAIFDHLGDMRNYLHGFAEIITSPLL